MSNKNFEQVQKGWNFDDNYNTPNSGGPIDWAPSRFHIRTENLNKDVYVTLLDSDPIKVLEHELTIGDTWNNRFICPEMFGNQCYFCQDVEVKDWDGQIVDETPYNIWLLTVINNTGWVNDDGEEFRNVKQVLPMKRTAAKLVKQKMDDVREQGDQPEFFQFKVRRTGKQQSRIGDDWNLAKQLNPEILQEEADDDLDLEPYDWDEIMEVKDYDEQKKIYESGSQDTPDEILEQAETEVEDSSDSSQDKDFFDEGDDDGTESTSEASSGSESNEPMVNY